MKDKQKLLNFVIFIIKKLFEITKRLLLSILRSKTILLTVVIILVSFFLLLGLPGFLVYEGVRLATNAVFGEVFIPLDSFEVEIWPVALLLSALNSLRRSGPVAT